MKILFSNPPWWHKEGDTLCHGTRAGSRWPFTHHAYHAPDKFRFGGYIPFPFFMGYAASYTAKALPDAEITFRDSIARGEGYGTYFDYLQQEKPDWIVIETATPSWEHDARLLGVIAARVPSASVILAGTIDETKANEILAAHPNVVAIVQGEYDKQIVRVIHFGDRGLVARHLLTEAEMNAAPPPMWDDECALNYWDACPTGQVPPQLQVWTSRGCPFRCCFCVWPATMTGDDPDGTKPRKVRTYTPEYMRAFLTERIKWAKARGTPYKSIYLDDDTANLLNKHTIAMCDVMKEIGLPWSAMCRADTSTPEVWKLMRDSGCFGVKIGFESGSQYVVDKIVNKHLDLKKAEATCRYLRELGMTVHGTFTVGLPGETKEQEQETRSFIARLRGDGTLTTHQLSGTAEIEGTPLHTLRKDGHLAAYPGAHIDKNYAVSPDGQKKIEEMVK